MFIYQESKFKAEAKSKGSTAYGYAQAIDAAWKHFQKDVKSNAKRNNFDDSTQFVGWYIVQLSKSLQLKMTDGYSLYKAKIGEDKILAQKVKYFSKHYQAQFKKCKI